MKKIKLSSMNKMHDQYLELLTESFKDDNAYNKLASASMIADKKASPLKIGVLKALVWNTTFNKSI